MSILRPLSMVLIAGASSCGKRCTNGVVLVSSMTATNILFDSAPPPYHQLVMRSPLCSLLLAPNPRADILVSAVPDVAKSPSSGETITLPHNEQRVNVPVLRTPDMTDSCLQGNLQATPFVWEFSFCLEPSDLIARTIPQTKSDCRSGS